MRFFAAFLLFCAVFALPKTSSAFLATPDNPVEVRACSDYFYATEREHERTAEENFKTSANQKCSELGYNKWKIIYIRWTGGIDVDRFCKVGSVQCE